MGKRVADMTETDRERLRLKAQARRGTHAALISAQRKAAYRAVSPEQAEERRIKHRAKYQEYRERSIAKSKAWYEANKDRVSFDLSEKNRKRKITIIQHYSRGLMCCLSCGFTTIEALCIDHINDDGQAQRLALFGRRDTGGDKFYKWLIKNEFPDGLQVLCANCNMIKDMKRRREMRLQRREKVTLF